MVATSKQQQASTGGVEARRGEGSSRRGQARPGAREVGAGRLQGAVQGRGHGGREQRQGAVGGNAGSGDAWGSRACEDHGRGA